MPLNDVQGPAVPAFPADAVEVGRIGGAWGVRGWIRVQPFSADPQALFGSRRWFLQPPPGPGAAPLRPGAAALPPLVQVVEVREHGDEVVARLRDVDDRDGAEALRGARIHVSRASFPSAGDDEFYWVDLIGCGVVNRQGVVLGPVVGLIETGPHCVLRIGAAADAPAPAAGTDAHLVPFVDAYVDAVDLAARTITVDWQPDY